MMKLSIDEAKGLVIRAGMELVKDGLIARTWGNVSCRISDEQFVITPSGRAYKGLGPEDIVTCNIRDLRHEGDVEPSSEKGVHALIYSLSEQAGFVIHTHQTMATAAGLLFKAGGARTARMPVGEPEAEVLGNSVPVSGYGLSASAGLRAKVKKALSGGETGHAVMMSHHGALCFASDMQGAFNAAHALESACKKYIGALDFDLLAGEYSPSKHAEDIQLPTYVKKAIYDARSDVSHISLYASGEVRWLSQRRRKVRPLIDDFAQIIGRELNVTDPVRCKSDADRLIKAAGRQNAVLIRGVGAVCMTSSHEDLAAIEMILDKGAICQAAVEKFNCQRPLGAADCALMRSLYLKSYSRKIRG